MSDNRIKDVLSEWLPKLEQLHELRIEGNHCRSQQQTQDLLERLQKKQSHTEDKGEQGETNKPLASPFKNLANALNFAKIVEIREKYKKKVLDELQPNGNDPEHPHVAEEAEVSKESEPVHKEQLCQAADCLQKPEDGEGPTNDSPEHAPLIARIRELWTQEEAKTTSLHGSKTGASGDRKCGTSG